MSYYAIVSTLKNVRKHPNADRLQLAEVCGNTVCVSLDYVEGQLGIYFPTDGQLSVEFAEANNLLRKKDENGNNIGGYMDPDKRNVTAIKLRGEQSDGLFLPLHCLESFGDITKLKVGEHIDLFNGHEICCKYIPRTNPRQTNIQSSGAGKRKNKKLKLKRPESAKNFNEHKHTDQLQYNLSAFKANDEVEISLKMHGTSQRTGYLKIFKGYKRTLLDKILGRPGTPIYDWGYISGTRRTVLDSYDGGFYGSNQFREQHHEAFVGKLWKGETVYYEVVGFTHLGQPIMGSVNNAKLQDKEFIKQYGETTCFSYGCSPYANATVLDTKDGNFAEYVPVGPQSDIYVYRMTMTNEDGDVVEYTPDFMRYRCEQMGIKTVPAFTKFILHDYDLEMDTRTPGEIVNDAAEKYYDGPDPVGKTHVREGVVVRIINRPSFSAYKLKNFSFKVLEGIVKLEADAPDMEEAEDMLNEEQSDE